ncbi:Outer membrane protein beta-barrel family protein [Arachidicoccus rhizosphaerae]|uniref:Outer membrane protein beta-barrel family protein n=2 Tax=Arachidicoccus rhizosphaerae TaxID=551991 RepID=A0A1H4B345_9BACT|nr:Outer membrane protein beta-barrel family protein [Arachidicoccus rhizosphaerae]
MQQKQTPYSVRSHLLIILLLLGCLFSANPMLLAQQASKKGTILNGQFQDSQKKPVRGATIKLMHASDTAKALYRISDSLGKFSFTGLTADTYILDIQVQNYENLHKYISVDQQKDSVQLGVITLADHYNDMETVSVTAVRPVTMNGDTTEFNADAYTVKPDATAGDLLSKMAGLEVDKDGNVQSDGQPVPKIYVNGKPFFGDNPAMAVKNLPADAIKKIQVYDAQTDQSKFTGFDDGERIRTINIVTRRKFKGLFGRPSVAIGSRDASLKNPLYRIDGKAFLYGPDKQLSFVAKADNTRGARVGKNHGSTYGANYRNKIGETSKIAASYMLNKNMGSGDSRTWRQDLYTNDTVFNKNTVRSSWNQQINHNFNLDWETKFDSTNELYIRPRYSIASDHNTNSSTTTIDSAYKEQVTPKNKTVNSGRSDGNQHNFNLSATYNHRFKKRGRSISLDLNMNSNSNDRIRTSNTELFDYVADSLEITRRKFINTANNTSYRANLDYTEPLGLHHMLQLELNGAYSNSESDQRAFNYDSLSSGYTDIDSVLTNLYGNTYQSTRTTLSYRYHDEHVRFSVGSGTQWGNVRSLNRTKNTDIHQDYVNLYPTASFSYKFNKWRRLRFRYSGRTSQPSVSQMQPIVDNSNPLYIRAGNPDLKQRFNHNAFIEYSTRDSVTSRSFYGKIDAELAENSVVNSVTRLDNGGQYSIPVNINGNYQMSAYLGVGLPIHWIESNLDLQTRINRQHMVSLIDGVKNYTTQHVFSETFRWRSNLKKALDINLTTRPTYHLTNYSVSKSTDGNYFDQLIAFDGTWYSESGWESSAGFHYTLYAGLPKEQQNNSTILNISFAKSFAQKAAKLTLSVTDLLNQSNGMDFVRSDNFIQQTQNDVFKRYFLLTFSYNLKDLHLHFGGSKSAEQKEDAGESQPHSGHKNRNSGDGHARGGRAGRNV